MLRLFAVEILALAWLPHRATVWLACFWSLCLVEVGSDVVLIAFLAKEVGRQAFYCLSVCPSRYQAAAIQSAEASIRELALLRTEYSYRHCIKEGTYEEVRQLNSTSEPLPKWLRFRLLYHLGLERALL